MTGRHNQAPRASSNRALQRCTMGPGRAKPEAISAEFPGMLEQWRRDPTGMRPPGGESAEELHQRLQSWLMEVSTSYQNKKLLVVSHSGTLRMLIALALRAPIASTRHMDMPYACWSRLYCDGEGTRLAFHQRA